MRWIFLVAVMVIGDVSFAQLQLHPVQRHIGSVNARSRQSAARVKTVTPLALPFWDDFSTTKGLYPDSNKWVHSNTVWINESMGINAPTVRVATFDGLDSAGLAYNSNDILLTGFTDSLVSLPIDLSVAAVGAADTNSVYLSFFYELQGNGEPPDPDDFLQVEFRNKDLQWESYLTVEPKNDFDATVFYDTIVKVTGERFFHDAFQFRFRSYGRQSGPYDTWNIDYVYLNKNRNINDRYFDDRAAASPVSQLFGQYRAVPYRHFKAVNPIDTVYFDVKNLSNAPLASIGYQASTVIRNYIGNAVTVSEHTLVSGGSVKGGVPMNALERVHQKIEALPDASWLDPTADSVDIIMKANVVGNDNTSIINTTVNDSVSTTYRLSNYFAYDDGTPEYSVSLIEPGDLAAYEFNMLKVTPDSVFADTLIAIDVYFPAYAITTNQTLNFTIYHEGAGTQKGKPGEVWLTLTPRQLASNGLNFTRLKFQPSILINEEKFFIGWKQPAAAKIYVGLDADNDTGNKIFVNTNSQDWDQNTTIKGSLMIRPVFGSGTIDVIDGVADKEVLSFYPNPTSGGFYINAKVDDLKIYNATGAAIPFEATTEGNQMFVQLHQPSGVYLVRYLKGNSVRTQKIMVGR
jgi:hypothetical protein